VYWKNVTGKSVFLLYFYNATGNKAGVQRPRGAVPAEIAGTAEKIPVEPEQGNACAGKVNQHCSILLFAIASIPPIIF
jgi:hypothetical protein